MMDVSQASCELISGDMCLLMRARGPELRDTACIQQAYLVPSVCKSLWVTLMI